MRSPSPLETPLPHGTGGPSLAVLVASAVAAVLITLGLTEQVLAHGGLVVADHQVHAWVVQHRVGWLTTGMRAVTWLGSNALLLPVLLVAVLVLARVRRSWRPLVDTAVVYGAAVVLYEVMKQVVHRPRPPASDWLTPAQGWAFPSGHTTQATAAWGILCVLVCVGRSSRVRAVLMSWWVLIAVLVAASRVYLGVHWASDVVGGITLGVAVLALWAIARVTVWMRQGSRGSGPARGPFM